MYIIYITDIYINTYQFRLFERTSYVTQMQIGEVGIEYFIS